VTDSTTNLRRDGAAPSSFTRRDVLRLAAWSTAFAAFHRAVASNAVVADEIVPGRSGPLALPPGFHQTVVSRRGERMSDGFLVPGKHDGMCAAPWRVLSDPNLRDPTKVVLVRNHEIEPVMGTEIGPFGADLAGLARVDRAKLYDAGRAGVPCLGGTTTLVFDTARQELVSHHLSLAGTGVNCAGGLALWADRTPVWITCEEWTQRANEKEFARDHGYCFAVPAVADGGLAAAVPLTALGRFKHEAVAVDPVTGIVYLTEDVGDGCFYRFLPETPGSLERGRLQALVATERPSFDGRNWPPFDAKGKAAGAPVITARTGDRFATRWIDVDEIDSPKDDLRHRAFAQGAMRFARCEGIWQTKDAIVIAATTGGPQQLGQLWRYRPSPAEGRPEEANAPGSIELFVESHDKTVLKNCDNLCASASGELFVCEDGSGRDGIVRVQNDGTVRRFAMNVLNDSELAGVVFSPDGSTLFVNIQDPGMTIAVTGPWER
jgi:secreted PhoX family phosphatase